jgi:hypothetical protein
MTSMTTATVRVIGGVDTHGQSHHAAVIDGVGRQLDDREFPASPAGYGALLEWLRGYGELDRVGVEGTGTYGVALTRHLREAGALVVEVDRPDRRARRAQGKSDPLDAYSAARAALSGAASVVPKRRDGRVEAIRAVRVARSSAVKAVARPRIRLRPSSSPVRRSCAICPLGWSLRPAHDCALATISAMPNRPPSPLRSRSRPHATRRSHPRIRRETNPRRASQARNHPLSQRCPRDLQHTQSDDANNEARTTTCQTIGASTHLRAVAGVLGGHGQFSGIAGG